MVIVWGEGCINLILATFHNIYVYQIITLFTTMFVIRPLYLNKGGGGNSNYYTKIPQVIFAFIDIRWFYNLDNVDFIIWTRASYFVARMDILKRRQLLFSNSKNLRRFHEQHLQYSSFVEQEEGSKKNQSVVKSSHSFWKYIS